MWCCLVLPSRIPPLRIRIGQEPEKLLVNTQICEQFCLVTLPKLKVSLNYGERWRRPNRLQKKTVLFWRALPLWCRWRESLGRGVGWATKARQGSWHSWELPESLERGDQSLEGRIHPSAIPGATAKWTVFIVTKCHSTQGRIFKESLDEWELLVTPCFLKCVMTGIWAVPSL